MGLEGLRGSAGVMSPPRGGAWIETALVIGTISFRSRSAPHPHPVLNQLIGHKPRLAASDASKANSSSVERWGIRDRQCKLAPIRGMPFLMHVPMYLAQR